METPVSLMQSTKLIITNKTALAAKYGDQHTQLLQDLQRLQEFDKSRQLDTNIVFLDDATQMASFQAPPVTTPTDDAQNKNAIDALYTHFTPGYILIAGAQDIVPFQRLTNLVGGDHDPDSLIPSDLPYACDAPYDKDPGKFIAPSRVLGRLPDIPGNPDPSYFHSLVNNILQYTPQERNIYENYFSLSTFDWQDSTQRSLMNIFGNNNALRLIPGENIPDNGDWSADQLTPKTHFINCHGALNNPRYYGQKQSDFPLAMKSDLIKGRVPVGTVVAAECCYGAQLFDPAKNVFKQISMANSYLGNNAIAFLGSSNIAYGPSTGQGLADLLTQFFVINVLNGASTGRALLEARQKFLNEMGPTLDPYELKTAAQFNLLGDPSIQPVINEKDAPVDNSQSFVNSIQNRRENMEARGKMLDMFISSPEPDNDEEANDHLNKSMDSLLQDRQFKATKHKRTFINRHKRQDNKPSVKFHVFSETTPASEQASGVKVLVVKAKNNQILGYREYVSR
ncbi:peptidase C25-like protein [Chitinophaga dinghuensis]|uniref:Peptidase C25-like protein n=2 Tax=Chitinophaga dinghuensis TaxID=1539050 RepID=A0A327W4B7_9BACT|nr:peptidase C25-like protein [Chitinophaga dinghuensis]